MRARAARPGQALLGPGQHAALLPAGEVPRAPLLAVAPSAHSLLVWGPGIDRLGHGNDLGRCACRVCTLLAGLASGGVAAVSAMLERQVPALVADSLHQYLQAACPAADDPDPCADWSGSPSANDESDASFPSVAAVDAALDTLEVPPWDDLTADTTADITALP